jgi:putative peptidoglycan lipid II flippase
LLAILDTLHLFFIPAVVPAALSFPEIFYILIFAPVVIQGNQIKGLAVSIIVS